MQTKSSDRALVCKEELKHLCDDNHGINISNFEELPRDIVLSILEFVEVAISELDSQTHLFGYFKSDPHRTIDVIFRCIQIADSNTMAIRLNQLLPTTKKLISLCIRGKESPQIISLAYPKPVHLERITSSLAERFTNIQSLTIRNCKYSLSLVGAIVHSSRDLKNVSLVNPESSLAPEDFIYTFSRCNLSSLVLDQKSLDDVMLSQVLRQNAQLKHLTLLGYFIDLNNISVTSDVTLTFPSSLESLSVGYRSLRDHKNLPWIFGPNLRKLDVSGITINPAFTTLATKNTNLTHLRLHMCDLSDSGSFATMMSCFNRLSKLDISWSKIVNFANVETICKLPMLTDLSCCNCRITDELARPILKKISIQTMNLEENRLDEKIVDDIVTCKSPNLRISVCGTDGRHVFVKKSGGVLHDLGTPLCV
jgi:uncharacterized protein YjbI with pentapeptide repeats